MNRLLSSVAVEPGGQGVEFAVSAEANEEAMGSQHTHQSVQFGFEDFYCIRFFSLLIDHLTSSFIASAEDRHGMSKRNCLSQSIAVLDRR